MEHRIRQCPVAVVGGAGFLGSHLVNHLIEDRLCEVLVVDNLRAGRREYIHPKAQFVQHDITGSEKYLADLFKSRCIQYAFNYAAWPYVPDSYSRPMQVFSVNCMGAIKVINAAHEAGVRGILQVSSAELYGESHDKASIDESAVVAPRSSYGAAKAAVDFYCQTAWKEREVPVVALRQFNCIGERETHPYVITEIIDQLAALHGSRLPVLYLGNNSRRDFMYAGDAVASAVLLLESGPRCFGQVYNLGSEFCIEVYQLAKLVANAMGMADIRIVKTGSKVRKWEIWYLRSNNSKITSLIGEVPKTVSLEQAIERTVSWFMSTGKRWPWK